MARRPGFESTLLVLAFLLACSKSRSGSDAGDAAGAAGTAGTPSDAGGSGGGSAGASGTGGATGGGGQGGTGGTGGTGGAGGAVGTGGTGGSAVQTCNGFIVPADHPDHAAYDATVAGVVTDAVTGLTWQRAVIDEDPNYGSAAAHCAGLTLNGASGWRLPSVLELLSIVDFAVAKPAIDRTAFPSTPASWFMTSTGVYLNGSTVGGANWGHTIDFSTGLTLNGMPNSGSVRCVRYASSPRCYPADGRFTATSSSGVDAILDAATGLTWQKTPSADKLGWPAAGSYCASLGGDFRLPGAKELLSLVDWKARGVAIDASAFPDTPEGEFWTSSRVAGAATNAVTVDFTRSESAGTFCAATTSPQNVRCVR